MRGRAAATLVAAGFAILAPLVPPTGLLSSAAVGLVTLRLGERQGALLTLSATLAAALPGWMLLGSPMGALGFDLSLWLPMLVLGSVLRRTRSLPVAIETAMVFGVVLILINVLTMTDPVQDWQPILAPLSEAFRESQVLSDEQRAALVNWLARWMTGILGALFLLQMAVSLFLARWWQALLYNPGGFQAEFHALRLHRWLAYLGAPVFLLMLLGPGKAADWVRYIGLLLVLGYFFQGLAVTHNSIARGGMRTAWLVVLYVLLVIAMPHVVLVLAVVGYTDAWLDLRARWRRS
jgi:hypothetical protein